MPDQTNKQKNRSSLEVSGGNVTNKAKKKTVKSTKMDAIKRGVDPIDNVNKYYLNLSVKYKIAKYVTVVLLLIFTLTMLTVNSEDITVEKFRYMFRDFDASGLTSSGNYDSLVYTGGNSSEFGIYRNDLAVVIPGSTALYNSLGIQTFQHDNQFVNPHLVSSKKYLLVYDRGDTSCSYAVYNSFAVQKKESFDEPIYSAAVSDSGSYAILMQGSGYNGVVRFYDSDFELVTEVKKDKYPVCAVISKSGDELYVASLGNTDGEFVTDIDKITESGSQRIVSEDGKIPVSIKIMEDGRFAVIYTDCVVCYDKKGKITSSLELDSSRFASAAIGDKLICSVNSVKSVGNDKEIKVCDFEGKNIYSGSDSGELLVIRMYGDNIYLLFENRLTFIDAFKSKVKNADVDPNGMDVLVTEDGTVLVCYSGRTLPISF